METTFASKTTEKTGTQVIQRASKQPNSPEAEGGPPVGIPLFLQRSVGQQAVSASGVASPKTSANRLGSRRGRLPRSASRQSRNYNNRSAGSVIQTKLTVGQPGDVYEQEADRVAAQVMRMPESEKSPSMTIAEQIQPMLRVQRMCTKCGEEEKEQIQPKEAPGKTPTVAPGLETRLNATKGGGQRLSESVRSYMEPRFGADFSGVRVHTGGEAVQMNQELGAQAFTRGRDIYFGAGKVPGKNTLTAHELTHVVQQGAGKTASKVAKSGLGEPGNRLASQIIGDKTVAGKPTSRAGHIGIQRYSWDEFVEDAGSAATATGEAIGAAGEAVYEAGAAAGEAIGAAGEAVYEAGAEAVDWLGATAGQAALDSADALAGLFGGRVIIRRGCLIVTIPNIPLFPTFQKTLGETSPMGLFVPFASGGTLIGPFPVAGMIGALAYAQLSAEAAVGPGELRNIQVEICPFRGRYMGTAQLYAAAAIGPRLKLFGGLLAVGGVLIPVKPPIPIIASIEGGLRGIGTGWLIGAVKNTVTVLYSGGGLSFSNVTNLMGGVLLQGDLQLFAALRLFEDIVCQYAHPLGHWETGKAMQLTIPVHASLRGSSGTGGVGPITWGSIPIEDVETAIRPLPTGWDCLSWDEIKQILCDNGVLPPAMCPKPTGGALPGGVVPPGPGPGPSVSPPVPLIPPSIGPQGKSCKTDPGDCTVERCEKLQAEVNQRCKTVSFSCKEGESCPKTKSKMRRAEKCAQAREKINKECYGGGDEGHRRAAKNAREAQKRCKELIKVNC